MKDNIPDWKVQTNEWNVEDSRAWGTEDTDKFFYEIEEKKNEFSRFIKKEFCISTGVASVLVGTFTGVRYIVNLTDTINTNQQEIVDLKRDLKVAEDKIVDQNTRLTSAESTWQMAENLYRQLADQVREHDYDIKDLNR